jgi:hypothetical protein
MIIVDPITLGDTSFSRPSVKNVYNGNGTLVEVPANTLGVTYDPADLSKAPWALLESAATNYLRNNTMAGAVAGAPGTKPSSWGFLDGVDATVLGISATVVDLPLESGVSCIDLRYQGIANTSGSLYVRFEFNETVAAVAGQNWVSSFFYRMRPSSGLPASIRSFVTERSGSSHIQQTNGDAIPVSGLPLARYSQSIQISNSATAFIHAGVAIAVVAGQSYDFTLRIGLPQLERDRLTSPIKTSGSTVSRAADIVGTVAGLLYSNVPIAEPDYSAGATYAKDALVHDPVTHNVFKSLIDANKGKALTDPAAWNPRGATNRWAMLDQYNNTQTAYPEEIIIVLTPQAISEGLYIGNCEADEIELSVVDQSEGLVASEVTSLVTASGTSSYFDWCFRPADRSDYFVTTSLPPYANALVLVAIRKSGGVPKCGMLAIGGVDDFGPSLYGLSAEGKDYSSTTFNFDGTTNTELRPYAKKMSVDVQVDNSEIDYIQRKLFQIRQRPIVWIGGPYGATAVFGRYGSFKIVIPGLKKSDMALQIEGSV